MSGNFWATRLGTAPAAPAAPPVMPTARPWWQQPSGLPQQQQAPQPQQPPQYPQQAAPVENPVDESGWGTVAGSMAKAKSAKLTATCPECDSTNFFRPAGQPNAMEQCYDCGYNPRFSQMSAQGGLPSDASAPAQPARQIASGGLGGASNFNARNIVARVN